MKIKIFFLIILTKGCDPYPNGGLEKEAIYYDTDTFYDFVHQVDNISLDNAWNKRISYIENRRDKNPVFGSYFFAIVENHYIFPIYYYPKMNYVILEGVWVHAKTGEARYVKTKDYIKMNGNKRWCKVGSYENC